MQLSSHIIRLALDAASNSPALDVVTSESPVLWRGNDVTFQLGLFQAGTLIDPSNLASITLEVKSSTDRGGPSLMLGTVAAASINAALTLANWTNNTDQHLSVTFTGASTAVDLAGATEATFWVTVFALTTASPAARITLGYTTLRIIEDGSTTPGTTSPLPSAGYYTKDQSDARYAAQVPLTSINSSIATLTTGLAAATATANAAVPASTKGAANGVASLDSGGHIPTGQLPAAIPAPSNSAPATLAVGQAPSAGTATTYLRSDATPGLPGLATETTPGFMSAADKAALDAIAGGVGGGNVGFDNIVTDVIVGADGAIYCAGIFGNYGNAAATSIARLSVNGVLDTVWQARWANSVGGPSYSHIDQLAVASDGDILALQIGSATFSPTAANNPESGTVGTGNGYIGQPILKFNPTGGLDTVWNLGSPIGIGSSETVRAMAADASGHVVIITDTTLRVVDLTGASLRAKAATGALHAVAAGTGTQVYLTSTCYTSSTVGATYDGGSGSRGLKLIDTTTGSMVGTWATNAGTGAKAAGLRRAVAGYSAALGSYVVAGITLDDAGTDILPTGGGDTSWNGANASNFGGLIRILSTGLADTTFSVTITLAASGCPKPLAIDSTGRIYLTGPIASINGTSVTPNGLYRLLANGNLDKEFTGFSGGQVNALALVNDNVLVVGGGFTSYHGKGVGYILFIDSNGTVITGQPAFSLGAGEGLVLRSATLPDPTVNPKYANYLVIQPFNPPVLNIWNSVTNAWVSVASTIPVAPPGLPGVTFSPASGTAIGSGLSVTIAAAGYPGAEIRYTTDGSTPTATSTLYSGAITVSSPETIKAYARASGYADGPVTTAQYASGALTACVPPTFNPPDGTGVPATVALSCTQGGASIYYTLDGSTPSASSTLYTGPITLNAATTIKAIATASGYTPSHLAIATYPNAPRVPNPVITVASVTMSGYTFTSFTPAAGTGSPSGTVIRWVTVPANTYTDVTSTNDAIASVQNAAGGYWGYFRAFAPGYAASQLIRAYWDSGAGAQVTQIAG